MLRILAGFSGWLAGLRTAPTGPRPGGRKRRNHTEFTSYYGRPVIKKPHWVWPVWGYFWAGGIVAGASAISTLAELLGDKKRDASIVRAGRYISLAGMVVSPVLLVIDLQRPERFHHMLRVLKLRSPLSVGTYILTTTGILTGLNTARQVVEDGLIGRHTLPGRLALISSNRLTVALQGLDGMALGTYTGVLLSATAVPLWAEADTVLAPLFLSSAFSTGAAAITLTRLAGGVPTEDLHRLDTIERGALLSELLLTTYGALKLKPQVRKHVVSGRDGALMGLAVGLGQIIPLLVQLLGPKHGPLARTVILINSVLVLAGGFLLRVAIVEAGKTSADDSDAYHATTRGPARATPAEQAAQYRPLLDQPVPVVKGQNPV